MERCSIDRPCPARNLDHVFLWGECISVGGLELGVAKRCQFFSTDQPGVGHCYWCADGGTCPDSLPAPSAPLYGPPAVLCLIHGCHRPRGHEGWPDAGHLGRRDEGAWARG